MNLEYFIYYLLAINLISAVAFYTDKRKAIKNKRRIAENKLHVLELMGGVFFVLLMIYLIRHKNKKLAYFIWTYLIFTGWVLLVYFASTYNLFNA